MQGKPDNETSPKFGFLWDALLNPDDKEYPVTKERWGETPYIPRDLIQNPYYLSDNIQELFWARIDETLISLLADSFLENKMSTYKWRYVTQLDGYAQEQVFGVDADTSTYTQREYWATGWYTNYGIHIGLDQIQKGANNFSIWFEHQKMLCIDVLERFGQRTVWELIHDHEFPVLDMFKTYGGANFSVEEFNRRYILPFTNIVRGQIHSLPKLKVELDSTVFPDYYPERYQESSGKKNWVYLVNPRIMRYLKFKKDENMWQLFEDIGASKSDPNPFKRSIYDWVQGKFTFNGDFWYETNKLRVKGHIVGVDNQTYAAEVPVYYPFTPYNLKNNVNDIPLSDYNIEVINDDTQGFQTLEYKKCLEAFLEIEELPRAWFDGDLKKKHQINNILKNIILDEKDADRMGVDTITISAADYLIIAHKQYIDLDQREKDKYDASILNIDASNLDHDDFLKLCKARCEAGIDVPFGIWVIKRKVMLADKISAVRAKSIDLYNTEIISMGSQHPLNGQIKIVPQKGFAALCKNPKDIMNILDVHYEKCMYGGGFKIFSDKKKRLRKVAHGITPISLLKEANCFVVPVTLNEVLREVPLSYIDRTGFDDFDKYEDKLKQLKVFDDENPKTAYFTTHKFVNRVYKWGHGFEVTPMSALIVNKRGRFMERTGVWRGYQKPANKNDDIPKNIIPEDGWNKKCNGKWWYDKQPTFNFKIENIEQLGGHQ